MASELEEGAELRLDFEKLIRAVASTPQILPVAVQNVETKEVILVAYTNQLAFERSLETRVATFWSTSRNELWIKGATSGQVFELVGIRVNCEQNSLLYLVRQQGEGICHTKNSRGRARDCFYREVNLETLALDNLDP